MSERPFMQLYVSDYLGDTRHLSCEQHGAYLLLLMTMWNAGGALPDDDAKLARIVCLSVKKWRSIRDDILAFFDVADGQVSHARLTKELQKSESKSQSRASAGAKGGRAKALKEKTPSLANAMPELCHSPDTIKSNEDADASSPSTSRFDEQFGEFWEAYPRKVSKLASRKVFPTALKAAGFVEIMAGVRRYADERRNEDPQFTMHPDRWLRGQHWADESTPKRRPPTGPPRPQTIGEMFREEARQAGLIDDAPHQDPGRMDARDGDRPAGRTGIARQFALPANLLGSLG